MSDKNRQNRPIKWDDASIGEYALGVMPAAERARFQSDLMREADLQRRLSLWEGHFGPMAMDIADATPPPALFNKIEGRLYGKAETQSFWQRVFGRNGLVAGAVAAALLVATPILIPPVPTTDSNDLAFSVQSADAGLTYAVAFDNSKGAMIVTREKGDVGSARDHQLWLIAGTNAPVSLGVLPDSGVIALAVSPELQAQLAGATLAISDEPDGGSPTGQPTGAVLATGVVIGA
jgi:anti-sigma-K factor RskA